MRIACVIGTNTSGGAERVMSVLVKGFAELGNETTLINLDWDSDFYKIDDRVNVLKLGKKYNIPVKTNKVVKVYKEIQALKDEFKRLKPDIVIVFLIYSEIPTIEACRQLNIPVVTSVRNSVDHFSRWQQVYRKMRYPLINGVVFQSTKVQKHPDFSKCRKSTVIMNPLDGNAFCDTSVATDRFKIINVGRLTPQKNQKMLIDAFSSVHKKHPETHLHIFGSGQMRDELVDYVNKLHLDRCVVFEGEVVDAIKLNNDAGIFVLSSKIEGFPNALVEAMANGIPVVSTDFNTGVARELIQDGNNGFVVGVDDVVTMADKMNTLIETPSLSEQFRQKGLEIRDKLNYLSISKEWLSFIDNIR